MRLCWLFLVCLTKSLWCASSVPLAAPVDSVIALPIKQIPHICGFRGHERAVLCVAAFPDGKVVSSSADGLIKVWDVFTSTCTSVFKVEKRDFAVGLAILSGSQFASRSWSEVIHVWDLSTEKCLRAFGDKKSGSITTWFYSGVEMLGSGELVSGSRDGTISVWDIATGKRIRDFYVPRGMLCMTKLGKNCLACGSAGKDYVHELITVLDMETGTVVCDSQDSIERFLPPLHLAALSGKKLISVDVRGLAKVWDLTNGSFVLTSTPQLATVRVRCLVVLQDGKVALGTWDGAVLVWDSSTDKFLYDLEKESGDYVQCLTLFDRNKTTYLVGGTKMGRVVVWDLGTA